MLPTTRFIVLLVLVAVGLLLTSVRVSAHADYERSEPGRNEVLPAPPPQVDLWFTQEVYRKEGANFVRVFDEQGFQVGEGDGVVDDDDRTHISTILPPDLPDGRYIVRWKSTSFDDDHVDDDENNAWCFYVGVEPTAEQKAECAVFDQEVPPTPALAVATPTEPEAAATPTGIGANATPSAAVPSDGDDGDGGVPTAAIVVGAIAGGAALVVIVGAVVAWLRRTLA